MIDEKVKSRSIVIPLSDNNIRSAGATALSDALKTNTSLTELCLDCGSRSQIQEYAFVFTFSQFKSMGLERQVKLHFVIYSRQTHHLLDLMLCDRIGMG